ncbi:MAG TPA: hypothetical protein VH256_03070, partial [Thermoleophilaceae bacterium]|nr:hypothetical protein [Thermoleophilaceae bacterium]
MSGRPAGQVDGSGAGRGGEECPPLERLTRIRADHDVTGSCKRREGNLGRHGRQQLGVGEERSREPRELLGGHGGKQPHR